MKSVMAHNFSLTPKVNTQRSTFNRSHGYKTTFDGGYLIPVFVDEALPGDTFNINMNFFARMATGLYPVMDNMKLDSFFFFVPNRILWTNWEKFMGAQDDPGDSIDYTLPIFDNTQAPLSTTGWLEGTISDYMGLPTKIATGAMPEQTSMFHRAAALIWNEWFRDENLQDSLTIPTGDGPDDPGGDICDLQRRGKRHDYFTSCLTSPQKGEAVSLPLGDSAPIIGLGKFDQTYQAGPQAVYETDGTATTNYANYQWMDNSAANTRFGVEEDPNNSGYPNIRADLEAATAATINAIRLAFQTQRFLEKDARGGTRYVELIRSHFNVISPDFRLQRPEYLGGGCSDVNIHPVTQTGETNTTPQGTLTSFGTCSGFNHGFVKSFTEHGIVIGFVSVRADLTYQEGLDRMFSRSTRYDFYWPTFAHLGEQAVLNKEIYCDGTSNDEDVFGYQERYAEYRYKPSKITGQFRSNATTPLDGWHLSQEFGALPTLNSTFIEDNPPIDRVIATPTEPHFIFDAYFNYICARPMPVFGVPGLVDHF